MKPSLVKGTRDFGPTIMLKRKFIINTIESVFKSYGFMPFETPAIEQLETLTGKYGDEGDQLVFKILNSGDFTANCDEATWAQKDSKKLTPKIAEKGLRYDLTVPLARYVAMNRNALTFPFKRYQMQPVWRADRPQRGRYREFWQCDIDCIGSDSLMNEADLLTIADLIFTKLGLKATIHINHRKLIEALASRFNISHNFKAFVNLIDKLDKIEFKSLAQDFENLGLSENQIQELQKLLTQLPFNEASIELNQEKLKDSNQAEIACKELKELASYMNLSKLNSPICLNLSLARGLDYYTGCIIEIKADSVNMGSISGGGRYDNLTGVFGLPGISGIGISFGIDRIYDVMEELNLFANVVQTDVKALLCHLDEKGRTYNFALANELRTNGIAIEVFPDVKKLAKQFEYAETKGIPVVIISGDDEILSGQFSYKNLITKKQGKIDRTELSEFLKQLPIS